MIETDAIQNPDNLTPHENPNPPREFPEHYRVKEGRLASIKEHGFNGCFILPYPRAGKVKGQSLICIIGEGMGWQHISVGIYNQPKQIRMNIAPTWADMDFVKNLFFGEQEGAVQIHPPRSMYNNPDPYCLHLWNCTVAMMPLPHPLMVGLVGYELGKDGKEMQIKEAAEAGAALGTVLGKKSLKPGRIEPKGEFAKRISMLPDGEYQMRNGEIVDAEPNPKMGLILPQNNILNQS